jgi:hypothetical protein
MGTSVRLLCAAVLGVLCTAVFGSAGPLTIGVQLTVTTALVMGGTGHPLVGEPADFVAQYLDGARDLFIAPSGITRGDSTDPAAYNMIAVQTPEQFWPVVGRDVFDASVAAGVHNLDSCLRSQISCKAAYFGSGVASTSGYVVFGYSQSARIATIVKRRLSGSSSVVAPHVSFVLVSNPNRPNGGILERFAGLHIPILGVSFDGATPTGSCDADGTDCRFLTTDITWQYDGYADFPRRPLNLLADLNALAGIVYLHRNYTESVAGAIYQGRTGDTSYYMLPSARLPLLMPLAQLGVPAPILDVLDAPLRVIVEWGYDRGVNPGDPAPAVLAASGDPVAKLRNVIAAIPVGLDDGLQDAGFGRPLGTRPSGTFGVGVATPPTTSPGSPEVRKPSVRPRGAAGPKTRATPKAGWARPKLGYVGGHGQVDRRNIVGHGRSGRDR